MSVRALSSSPAKSLKPMVAYCRERFPFPAVSILSLGTAIFLVAASSAQIENNTFLLTALIAVTFLAFLLRQRVMDEFKDQSHDDENYPNRPVQRGVITRKSLVYLGIFAFLLELSGVLSIWLISTQLISVLAYLAVLCFSGLTFYEFFAPTWLNKHFTLYFLTHQLIFVFFFLWGQSIFGFQEIQTAMPNGIAFMLVMAALEVMRKYEIRTNAKNEIVMDTYLAVWGRNASAVVLGLSFALSGLLIQSLNLWQAVIGTSVGLGLYLSRDSQKIVQALTVLGFFALGLVAYFL